MIYMYASPAWWKHLTADDRERLERSNRRAIRAGCLPPDAPILSAPWLNVKTTPSSMLLSEIVAMSFDTYVLDLTHSLYQTRTTETSSLGLFIKTFTDSSNSNLSTPRPPHRV